MLYTLNPKLFSNNVYFLFVSRTMLADIKEEIICLYSSFKQNEREQLYSNNQRAGIFFVLLCFVFFNLRKKLQREKKKRTTASF